MIGGTFVGKVCVLAIAGFGVVGMFQALPLAPVNPEIGWADQAHRLGVEGVLVTAAVVLWRANQGMVAALLSLTKSVSEAFVVNTKAVEFLTKSNDKLGEQVEELKQSVDRISTVKEVIGHRKS